MISLKLVVDIETCVGRMILGHIGMERVAYVCKGKATFPLTMKARWGIIAAAMQAFREPMVCNTCSGPLWSVVLYSTGKVD